MNPIQKLVTGVVTLTTLIAPSCSEDINLTKQELAIQEIETLYMHHQDYSHFAKFANSLAQQDSILNEGHNFMLQADSIYKSLDNTHKAKVDELYRLTFGISKGN